MLPELDDAEKTHLRTMLEDPVLQGVFRAYLFFCTEGWAVAGRVEEREQWWQRRRAVEDFWIEMVSLTSDLRPPDAPEPEEELEEENVGV